MSNNHKSEALLPQDLLKKLMIIVIGSIVAAYGITLAFYAGFALAEKNHWQVKIVRMALDILVVIIGVLLGGKFGVCTIITVIISGPIIQFINVKANNF